MKQGGVGGDPSSQARAWALGRKPAAWGLWRVGARPDSQGGRPRDMLRPQVCPLLCAALLPASPQEGAGLGASPGDFVCAPGLLLGPSLSERGRGWAGVVEGPGVRVRVPASFSCPGLAGPAVGLLGLGRAHMTVYGGPRAMVPC